MNENKTTLFYKEVNKTKLCQGWKQNNPFFTRMKTKQPFFTRMKWKQPFFTYLLGMFKYVTIGRYTSDTITIYTFIHNKYQAIICSMKISYLLFNTLLYISLTKRLVKKIFILNSIQIVKFSINYTFLDILSDNESVYINRERSLWKLSCLIDWLIDWLFDWWILRM